MVKLDVLTRPFGVTEIKQRKTEEGRTFDYVEAHSVITRLNEAFEGAWSFRVLQSQVVDHEVIILGELSADDQVKQQFGSAKYDKRGGGLLAGDAFKAAASDGLKKYATEFGVGLDLYIGHVWSEPGDAAEPLGVAEVSMPEPATDKQRAVLEKIVQRTDIPNDVRVRFQTALAGMLTKMDASDLIGSLTRKRAA